jgi:acetoin utilization deacetylase AcuC-like enzyme
VGPPIWLRHQTSFAHDIPGHPERPERLVALEAAMSAHDWFGWERVEAPEVTRSQLLAVHSDAHLDFVERVCAAGGGAIDADTMVVADSWPAALHAAGGAVALVDALMSGSAPCGFSAMRPPGHHAEPEQAMGFCLFGNVAVGAAHALTGHAAERVLIFDWDVHHGNGTNEIFRTSPDVLFVSAHQWPLYPGTGPVADVGSGLGEGFTVNLPVPPGSGDEVYRSLVDHIVVPLARAFEPRLILVSAGFDAHYADPLASCRVTEAGFAAMTASLRRVGEELEAPIGLVLEGGYDVDALADSVCALVPVLTGSESPAEVPVHPVTEGLAARLARWWPVLAPAASGPATSGPATSG